jgi:outer membrane biosynthesis protein TonB
MLTYFLQVNVCWLLFYGVYYALLSKETFFKLNRIWLITSLLCGLALPFAADYFAVKVAPTIVFAMTLEPFVVTAKALQQNLTVDTEGVVLKTIGVIYGLGCAVLTARFIAGLLLIFKILKQAKIEQQDGFKLAYTEGGISPFSFFNFIFINPNEFENYDFQQIMQHEKAHVQQRHSLDVVFLEILNIIFWCSPCIYFYKTSLRNVHEYLADEAVLRHNAPPQYGRLLLRQRQSGRALALTSNISNHFFSQLKKRILMMTRNKSKRPALIKYALAAPIFLILTAALASPETPILAKTEALSDNVVKTIFSKTLDNQDIKSLKTTTLSQIEPPQYFAADTTIKPLSDLKLVDPNQIERMDVDKKEEAMTQITITFKDGHVERYKGTKAEMEKVFKKEETETGQKISVQQTGKLDELVVVGRGSQKNAAGQKPQKLEDEKELKQQKEAVSDSKDPVFSVYDEQPEFPQGVPALYKFLGQNIKYPKVARDAGGQGTVFVGFIIEKDGSITNVQVKKDAPFIVRDTITLMESNGVKGNKIVEKTDFSLGKEAVRVVSMMPKWKPGKKDGKDVRVSYTLPIKFKLD